MLSTIYKEDIFDALVAAKFCDYITTSSSYKEIKENIYKILEFMYNRDEIDDFSEVEWNIIDEVINEWCERNKGC